MIHGEWKTVSILFNTNSTYSVEGDLGRQYETMLVVIPTIDNATVTPKGAEVSGGTFQDIYIVNPADGSSKKLATTSSTGGITCVMPIGGLRYIKLVTNNAQTANRAFRVCGVRS